MDTESPDIEISTPDPATEIETNPVAGDTAATEPAVSDQNDSQPIDADAENGAGEQDASADADDEIGVQIESELDQLVAGLTPATEDATSDSTQAATETEGAPSPIVPAVSQDALRRHWDNVKQDIESRWSQDSYDNSVERALVGFIEDVLIPSVSVGVQASESYNQMQLEQTGRAIAENAIEAAAALAKQYQVRVDPKALIALADVGYEAVCKLDGKQIGVPDAQDFRRIFEIKYGDKLNARQSNMKPKETTAAPRTISSKPNAGAQPSKLSRNEQIIADFHEGKARSERVR
jgi:hypothetical protein